MGPLPAPLRLQAITKLSRYLGLQVGSVQDPDYTWQVARTQLVARLALATRKTLTVDQRSLIATAIVIPKLLYIGRHQWPSKGTIQAFQKMIKNYIWHGRFTECDVGGRAWLNQHVATLPRQQGGLAVPDLKMELLALAAVTVNNWAVDSDPDTQILGDVLAGCQTVGVAPQMYITPRHTPPTVHNRRVKESIWSTGLSVCNSFGGVSPAASKAAMVVALHCTLYFRGPVVATWYGRRMTLDTQPLQGPLSRQYQATEETLHGDFCSEWVPYMALEELKLFTETGVARGIKSTMRALCRNGTLVKDVLHWRWLAKGGMLVTVLVDKFTRTIRRQAERLMVLILLNFPQLLRHGEHSGRIRYETKIRPMRRFNFVLTLNAGWKA
ncbi:hypothetical protein PF004_g29926 [Phytophthora fragariae]|uniref:Uncharacterized protein n=2 Tax=Phytophthora fragariae TaxID=53985 RepID=A0A6G0MDF9_9STRA|nr:hypothetical protein PF004_g29926 [Phytophthora fragariae]